MNQNIDLAEGYDKALALLHDCATPDGFVASPSERDNYQRVWGRDGAIIWPMLTGFYVADLARRQHTAEARKYLQAIHQANAMTMEDESWSFPEFVHGQKLTPVSTWHQGWSAAAAIIGRHTLEGQPIFRIGGYET
jgi:hypothetical protein